MTVYLASDLQVDSLPCLCYMSQHPHSPRHLHLVVSEEQEPAGATVHVKHLGNQSLPSALRTLHQEQGGAVRIQQHLESPVT